MSAIIEEPASDEEIGMLRDAARSFAARELSPGRLRT